MNRPKTPFHVERLNSHRPLRAWSLLALVLVPLLVAGLMLGTTWGRDKRLAKIDAAIVNSDKAVTVNGQLVPLGRQLASEIVAKQSQNITWTLSDPSDAASGLASGKYAAVVTIPENFSAAATSVKDAAKAQQATIDVETSPASPVADAQVARQVADLATQSTNAMLTGSYLGNIYVGFNEMGKNLTTMAGGAKQLASGAAQLSTGAQSASSGAGQLAGGLDKLDANSGQLVTGGQKLAGGAGQLQAGADKLASGVGSYTGGVSKVVDGIGSLSDGVTTYTDGTSKVVDGIAQLNGGIQQLNGSLQKASGAMDTSALAPLDQGAQGVSTGTKAVSAGLAQAQQKLSANGKGEQEAGRECAAAAVKAGVVDPTKIQSLCATVMGLGGQVASAKTATQLAPLVDGAQQTSDGATRLAGGVHTLVTELPKQAAAQTKQLRDGVGKLAAGSQTLATKSAALKSGGAQLASGATTLATKSAALKSGGSQLASGATQLGQGIGSYADGVTQYTQGVTQYAQGVHQVRGGADKLATGLTSLSGGTQKLASGTRTFADKVGQGATKVPSYSQQDREKLSTVVSTPVTGAADTISSPVKQATSLLLVLGAWLGAMATWLVVRPIASRTLTSSRPSWQIAGATMVPGLLVAVGQGLLLGILGSWVLHPGVARGIGLTAFMVLVAASFTAVNHALAAWLGGIGRTIAVVLATVTAAVGTISAVPGVFGTIHGASPLAPALTGVRAIVAHSSMGVGPIGILVVLLAAGALLSLLAVVRRRQLSPSAYRRAADADEPLR